MKKLVVFLLCAALSCSLFAQPPGGHGGVKDRKPGPGKEMMQRIRSEKIAYISAYAKLNKEEADRFWPLYHEMEDQQQKLTHAEREAFHALQSALEDGDRDIPARLDAYLAAKGKTAEAQRSAIHAYRRVLSVDKAARVLVAEEMFRREQIGKLRGTPPPGRPDGPPQDGEGHRKPERR
ncbi:MAG: hypothetical protein J5871_06345 [Bacteroidales bacterium]|nr:hypothetical protein [Bacteroidales bacterium]